MRCPSAGPGHGRPRLLDVRHRCLYGHGGDVCSEALQALVAEALVLRDAASSLCVERVGETLEVVLRMQQERVRRDATENRGMCA